MKKFRVVIALVLSTCILAGCSMPDIKNLIPGGNKNDVEQGGEDLPYTPEVTLNVAESYPVGTVLTYVDIATIEPEYEFEVADSAFMGDGTTGSEYTVVDGEQSVNLIIQFTNGAQYTAAVTIIGDSPLPDELMYNISHGYWSTKKLSYLAYQEAGLMVSYNEDVISTAFDLDPAFGMEQNILNDYGVWSIGCVGSRNEDRASQPTVASWKIRNSMSSVIQGEDSEFKTYLLSILDFLDMNGTISERDTGYVIYDVNGNCWPVYEVYCTLDLTSIGAARGEYHMVYYVSPDSAVRVYFDDMDRNSVLPWSEDDIDIPEDIDIKEVSESAETLSTFLFEHKDVLSPFIKDLTHKQSGDYNSGLSEFVNNILFGDVSILQGGNAPTGDVGSGDTEVPVDEDESELTGAAGKSFATYASRYPDIYKWPDNETKYRRWIYIIDENTRYTGSIINPDGTIMTSGGNILSSITDGSGQGGSTGGENTKGNQKYTLTSTYGSYEVNNENFGQATFDTENSTAGRLVVNYNNSKYYIETVRASRVLEYQRSCLYSTSNMQNGDFQVFEDNAKTNTNIGLITFYTIKYTATNGFETTEPYMATYNINNDYLVIYGDNLTGTNSDSKTLVTLLSELIK